MINISSDQKFFICLTTLKKLQETVDGELRTEYVKHSDGRVLTRYTLEYEDAEERTVPD